MSAPTKRLKARQAQLRAPELVILLDPPSGTQKPAQPLRALSQRRAEREES